MTRTTTVTRRSRFRPTLPFIFRIRSGWTVESPEPFRHGLTINRVREAIRGDLVVVVAQRGNNAGTIGELIQHAGRVPEAALIADTALAVADGQVLRVDPTAFIIRRDALGVIGDLDESLRSASDVIDDICGRLTRLSMPIIVTNRSLMSRSPHAVHPTTASRFPWLSASDYPLDRPKQEPSQRLASTRLNGPKIRVLVDGRNVRSLRNGTGRHFVSTVRALLGDRSCNLHVVADFDRAQLEAAGLANFNLDISPTIVPSANPVFDIALLPLQATSPDQVDALKDLAHKVVVNHLDFIAACNPSYFPTVDDWIAERRTSLASLERADGVAWLSHATAVEARSMGMNLHNTVERVCGTVVTQPIPPGETSNQWFDTHHFIATLGSSYHHKARMHSLRVMCHLLSIGWDGHLMMAGWDPPVGSSIVEEIDFVERNPHLHGRVHHLGELGDQRQSDLMRNASLLIQPSVAEGFGLVPFEAALLGTPSLLAQRTSTKELVPEHFKGWLTFSPAEDAMKALAAMTAAGDDLVTVLSDVAISFSEEKLCNELLALFTEVLAAG